jgi:hypothetical protein
MSKSCPSCGAGVGGMANNSLFTCKECHTAQCSKCCGKGFLSLTVHCKNCDGELKRVV